MKSVQPQGGRSDRESGRRTRVTRRRGRGDGGATLVEYALGVALLVAFAIPAVTFTQRETTDVVDRRADHLGAPDLGDTGTPVTLPPPTTTTPGGSIPPPPESVVTVSTSKSSVTVQKNVEWSATVGFTALDDTGNERELVEIVGEWSGPTLPAPVPMNCSTNLSGACALTIRSLSCPSTSSVTLTVTSVTGEGVTYNDPLPIVITVDRPTGSGQNQCN